MKCPYPNCRKDYNDTDWPKIAEDWSFLPSMNLSQYDKETLNRLFVVTRQCRFCNQLFHEIFVGQEKFKGHFSTKALEPIASYPMIKTKFEAKNIPQKIMDAFNEAERCRSVGSLTGAGSCLRKCIYEICDEQKVKGEDYREKITNLDVKDAYKDLLKQIKWLGDNTTKPGDEKYTMAMLDAAIEILPVLVDAIYLKDEKAEKINKLLAKARTAVNK